MPLRQCGIAGGAQIRKACISQGAPADRGAVDTICATVRVKLIRGEQPVTLNSGDQVKVYIIQPEDEHGNVVLSLRKARAEGIWQAVAEKESEGEILDAEVREQNKGGLIVNIMGLRGFLPSSQVARQFSGNLMELVGTKIPVKILEVNRKRNRLIVSQRAAQDEDRARLREELFEKLKVGDVITGKVSGVTSYGAFVNLGGADGLIHISELSWDRINNVSDVLKLASGVVIGTHFKVDGNTWNAVDGDRVKRFMDKVGELR